MKQHVLIPRQRRDLPHGIYQIGETQFGSRNSCHIDFETG